jgi:TolB-like protein
MISIGAGMIAVTSLLLGAATLPAAPATQPIEPNGRSPVMAPIELRPRLIVFPFQVIGGRTGDTWLGRSIQQSLLTDAAINAPIPAGSGAGYPADASEAAAAARTARSRYALLGFVHLNDEGGAMRVTGQIVDACTGRAVATIKSTGPAENLFPIEDDLAAQLQRAIAAMTNMPAPAAQQATTGEPPTQIESTGPVRMGYAYQTAPSPVFTPLPPPPPPAMVYRYHFGPTYAVYGYGGYGGYGFSNLYYRPVLPYYGSYYRPHYYRGYYPSLTITGAYRNGNFGLVFRSGY